MNQNKSGSGWTDAGAPECLPDSTVQIKMGTNFLEATSKTQREGVLPTYDVGISVHQGFSPGPDKVLWSLALV